ncbi:MAG: hypothetical protein H6599_10830 [Flavobacteriales bacterium]|nr:hypothetical protein [Flavobacteriales bacterium]
MKNVLYFTSIIILISLLSIRCNSEETDTNISQNNKSDMDMVVDTTDVITTDYSENPTISGVVEGPDQDLWIEDLGGLDKESIKNFNAIDLVPYVFQYDDSSNLYTSMKVIARDNFSVRYGELGEYTGTINLYYDAYKTKLASSFNVIDGLADGNCTLYDTDGSVIVERVFNKGKWLYSGKEPYSADWTFDQSTSSLIINDLKNGSREGGLIEIMPSHQDNGYTWMNEIIEKESFNNTFIINGEAFTGTLKGFDHPTDYDIQQFELNFKDGFLHGDIKIFNWWGDLELHETFENGVFIEEIYKMDESMMDGVAKPIIYLYPEKETKILVNLNFEGHLTHTYPKYEHGWKVTASPDGTLIDENGKEFYALYWEGKETSLLTIPNGTVLKGSETINFLEEELPKMGLNARETNEFIIFWMPYLENNTYNLIHFASDAYTDIAALNITPQPETMIRVMMIFQPLENEIKIQKQNLSELYKVRKGFTVVEWGGRKIAPIFN